MADVYNNVSLEILPLIGRLNLKELDELDYTYVYPLDAWTVFVNLVEFTLIFCSICASISISVAVKKFDFLKNRVNVYLFHYGICSSAFYIFRIISESSLTMLVFQYMNGLIFCVVYSLDNIIFLLVTTFCTLVSIELLIMLLNESYSEKCNMTQKFIIGFFYILYFICYCLTAISCHIELMSSEFSMYIFCIMIVIVIFVNIFTCFKKSSDKYTQFSYGLSVANIVILYFSILILILFFTWHFFYSDGYIAILCMILEYLFDIFINIVPLVVAIRLNSLNSNFKKAFAILFQAKDYKDMEILVDEENIQVNNEANQGNSTTTFLV